jgi:acylphosphatase
MKYIVKGYVQGVGFRYFALRHARMLNISGYAKNNFDGSVEIIVEGNAKQLNMFYDLLKTGPSRSSVEKVVKTGTDCSGRYGGFDIF